VQAVKINAQDNLKYKVHIVGDGSFLETLKKLVKENGLQNYFIFYGRRPVSEMENFYELADACLLTLKGDSFVGQTIPGKLQGYMAAGKIVIAAIDGSAQSVIKEANCGLVGNAGDYKALAKNIDALVKNTADYKDYGINGRLYFKEHFTKGRYISCISKVLKELVT
jgi:glycosyltransferase involved in cell wall biosynthesis